MKKINFKLRESKYCSEFVGDEFIVKYSYDRSRVLFQVFRHNQIIPLFQIDTSLLRLVKLNKFFVDWYGFEVNVYNSSGELI